MMAEALRQGIDFSVGSLKCEFRSATVVRELPFERQCSFAHAVAITGWRLLPLLSAMSQWLPIGLIAHLHLNDSNLRGPGEGALSFATILRALTEGNYGGMASMSPSCTSPAGPRARRAGESGSCYLRSIREARSHIAHAS
jgi:hypothetical protein